MPDYVKGQEPYSRQGLLNSVEHSLKLLNTKKIDVLLIHDPYVDELQQAMAPGGMMEGMRELQQQGVVAHLGMAVRENEPLMLSIQDESDWCDVVQIVDDYCLCRRFAEESGVLAAAQAKDLGVVQAAPMYRGMLYNAGAHADKCPEVTAMIGGMTDWASARGHALPDLAVQFPSRHPALSTCIMGARSAAEVDGFVANSRVEVAEATWQEFEEAHADAIKEMPRSAHFYYVKPAQGVPCCLCLPACPVYRPWLPPDARCPSACLLLTTLAAAQVTSCGLRWGRTTSPIQPSWVTAQPRPSPHCAAPAASERPLRGACCSPKWNVLAAHDAGLSRA